MFNLEHLGAMPPEIARRLEDGYQCWQSGRLNIARAQLQIALDQAEAVHNVAGVLGARQLLGGLAHAQGDCEAAWEHHSYVLTCSRALGLGLGAASALHNLGLVAAQRGDLLVAIALLNATIAAYEELGRLESAAAARANLAHIIEARTI